MTDILLITDIPRVRKVLSRLADDSSVRIRVANNLEKGGDELAAEKPAAVLVQTHLSGLSADIILMHLKKQLGRKRTKFVLLATADQVNKETVDSYQGYLDIALSDAALADAGKALIASIRSRKSVKKEQEDSAVPASEPHDEVVKAIEELDKVEIQGQGAASDIGAALEPQQESLPEPKGMDDRQAYPRKTPLSVYSEFNTSFDEVVTKVDDKDTVKSRLEEARAKEIFFEEPKKPISRKVLYSLAVVGMVIVAVIVTYIQQKRETGTHEEKVVTVAPPKKQESAPKPVKPAVPPAAPLMQQVSVPTAPPAAAPAPPAPVPQKAAETPKPPPAPAVQKQPEIATAVTQQPKAQEKAAPKTEPSAKKVSSRPKQVPDFVPRYGHDKKYSQQNPGWERYMGYITEFKINREDGGIKAIQVVDRGGKGVPESFMRGAVRQLAKKPSFKVDSTEKKDGYEIQRGKLSDSQDFVFYRDADGGKLRAFVVTWK